MNIFGILLLFLLHVFDYKEICTVMDFYGRNLCSLATDLPTMRANLHTLAQHLYQACIRLAQAQCPYLK